ncbi:patatin-like phospholipase family protein [Belliella kenyensis]|uniref:Patatin-like phospholipase family protein n=1 Tax=Belliella kenyensis TaxID=1472724 RepID=A0ABV8EN91_9BACT|nr:patatin-like phospholipase family protein [Belliella kenyensis]MCH7400629.1 patatin-like phospholipase family protein [Belliella kenyensis]MDN3602084.1 patatin-like phospholipase family protein [Belliella kenyensis]
MLEKIQYSFPIQLLLLHLKKNLALLFLWVILILIITQNFGTVLGIPYLFLDPEYLNVVDWKGFFLMGISLAVFTMSFHMTTYILDGAKFKFLAVVSRPFIQFCVNNALIPLVFYLIYVYSFMSFQFDNDPENLWSVFKLLIGFLAGTFLSYMLIFIYFGFTNKDAFLLFADSVEKRLKKNPITRANMLKRIKESKESKYKVLDYLDFRMRVRFVNSDLSKFKQYQLLRVFDQNHLNLFIIQTILISLILLLGFFQEYPVLQIPAATSATLLFSIITMLVGALAFWLRDYSTPVLIGVLILFNGFSNISLFNRPHTAVGLDYEVSPARYNLDRLEANLHPDTIAKDKAGTLEILNNWKGKFPNDAKPRMILITTSGGGQRAALWTMNVLQQIQAHSDGQVFKHTQLITGASGGLVGAAFFREIYLRHQKEEIPNPLDKIYLDQISADNLNPIIFTLMVNDLFIRSQYHEYKGRRYLKDRGFSFERQFNSNTKGFLDKSLKDYAEPELKSQIPMLPVTPLIINDGRKLFISPHSMSYMGVSVSRVDAVNEKSQSIDFRRFFAEQEADNLHFISALRMGATFPFITPNIQLPSDPQMDVMDSGLSDNFGMQDALRFLHVFQDWIKENTSGVTLITIRDSEKFSEIEPKLQPRIFEKLITPLKNIYINWDNVQTLDNEVLYYKHKEWLPFELDRIEFEYSTSQFVRDRGLLNQDGDAAQQAHEIQRASLNWRLTSREKKSILEAIDSPLNRGALQKVARIRFLATDE